MGDTSASDSNNQVYVAVNNIPGSYHSADLRKFFSQFVETSGFDCFHFRHRPEQQSVKNSLEEASGLDDSASTNKGNSAKTFCCIIRVTENRFSDLLRTYHQRHWLDSKGESLSSWCLISRLKLSSSPVISGQNDSPPNHQPDSTKYQTRGDKKRIPPEREEFREEDLLKLPELRPPPVMLNGNVGTPTMHFLKLIQECKLPPSIIKKLQLDFPKSKGKGKYGSVPFDYQTNVVVIEDEDTDSEDRSATASSVDSPSTSSRGKVYEMCASTNGDSSAADNTDQHGSDKPASSAQSAKLDYMEARRLKKLAKRERRKLMNERIEENMVEFEKAGSDSGDDNDTCEEWERHEAMYDDVTNQGRTKDRLFEEEMEIVWEKGGSGLVFYTDAQYWQEKEGDFDEQTADDLDVDMSAYYEEGAGDKDIRDFIAVRQEQRRRRGQEATDRVTARITKLTPQSCQQSNGLSLGIGKFEQHTKGIGRKLLEQQGWTEGKGIGASVAGIAEALDNEGQHPRDRKGFGYRGEKLVRYCAAAAAARKRKREEEVCITTVYDKPANTDPQDSLLRRNDPSYIKHRNRIN